MDGVIKTDSYIYCTKKVDASPNGEKVLREHTLTIDKDKNLLGLYKPYDKDLSKIKPIKILK